MRQKCNIKWSTVTEFTSTLVCSGQKGDFKVIVLVVVICYWITSENGPTEHPSLNWIISDETKLGYALQHFVLRRRFGVQDQIRVWNEINLNIKSVNAVITYFGLEIHSWASCANVGKDQICSSFFENSAAPQESFTVVVVGAKRGTQDVCRALSDVLHASKCLKNYFEDQNLLNSFGKMWWKYCGILM